MRSSMRRSNNASTLVGSIALVTLYVIGALQLSDWVRAQSPSIEATLSAKTSLVGDSDGDGVSDGIDRCHALYAATPDGCPARRPPTGDWNADGQPQLTFVDTNDSRVFTWTLRDGVFAGADRLWPRTEPGWQVVGTSELTGDGKSDILWQDRTSVIRLFRMEVREKTGEQFVGPSVADRDWRVVATGDFDGDGHADIVWQHVQIGYVVIWFMRGENAQAVFGSVVYLTRAGDAAILDGCSAFDVAP